MSLMVSFLGFLATLHLCIFCDNLSAGAFQLFRQEMRIWRIQHWQYIDKFMANYSYFTKIFRESRMLLKRGTGSGERGTGNGSLGTSCQRKPP